MKLFPSRDCQRCGREGIATSIQLVGPLCEACLDTLAPRCSGCDHRNWDGRGTQWCQACGQSARMTFCGRHIPKRQSIQLGPFTYCGEALSENCECWRPTHCAECRHSLQPYIGDKDYNLCAVNGTKVFCPRCYPLTDRPHQQRCDSCGVTGIVELMQMHLERFVPGVMERQHHALAFCMTCAGNIRICQGCLRTVSDKTVELILADAAEGDELHETLAERDDTRPFFLYSQELEIGLCAACAALCPQCDRLCVLYDEGVCRFCYKYNHQLYEGVPR